MGTASVGLGRAGGGGAVPIPEGPGELEEMKCVPVNRHVRRGRRLTVAMCI